MFCGLHCVAFCVFCGLLCFVFCILLCFLLCVVFCLYYVFICVCVTDFVFTLEYFKLLGYSYELPLKVKHVFGGEDYTG